MSFIVVLLKYTKCIVKVSVKSEAKRTTAKAVSQTRSHTKTPLKKEKAVSLVEKAAKKLHDVPKTKPVSRSAAAKSTVVSKVKRSAKKKTKMMVKSLLLSKTFHKAFNVTAIGLLVFFASYIAYTNFTGTFKDEVVVSKSEIVDRVSKLTTLPNETPDDVVRVQDPETLKKQNTFYENVKEGDYIVMYSKMAVIYDLRNNVIVSEKRIEK